MARAGVFDGREGLGLPPERSARVSGCCAVEVTGLVARESVSAEYTGYDWRRDGDPVLADRQYDADRANLGFADAGQPCLWRLIQVAVASISLFCSRVTFAVARSSFRGVGCGA